MEPVTMSDRGIRRPTVIHRQMNVDADSDDDLFLPNPPENTPTTRHFITEEGVFSDTQQETLNDDGSGGKNADIPDGQTDPPGDNGETAPTGETETSSPQLPPPEHQNPNTIYWPGQHFSGVYAGTCLDPSPHGSTSQSIVEGLLLEIYDRWQYPQRDSLDSDTFTECSSTSEVFWGRGDSVDFVGGQRNTSRFNKIFLEGKESDVLKRMFAELQHRSVQQSARLVRELKRRDRRKAKVTKNCDIVTAILQASSLKRRIDSRIKFSIRPLPGDEAFNQWKDAMKAVARLPLGIPADFRKTVWLSLADQHIASLKIDWEKTKKFAFNERSNPDDNKLGMQIVKDLHRTGCSGFSGQDNEEERALLKRVLLAYARWNKNVGYCQGFNVLAALILQVVQRKEDDALKVMILLVDYVLPESYFANNLRALSVDMAVFRDLLRITLPQLSTHLDLLQSQARDEASGANYEPPLTNVFTMQWFLTLFATCLPQDTALRVWDSVLLEGSEILLRTALAIWGRLQERMLAVPSADEFYMTMGLVTQEMLDNCVVDADDLIKMIYGMAPFPFPQMAELREKYTYNITPFSAAMSTGGQRSKRSGVTNVFSDDDDVLDEDDLMENINCFTGIFPTQNISPSKQKALCEEDKDKSHTNSTFDISKASPGAYAANPSEALSLHASALAERMTMDINQLKNQYLRVRERQKQAHIILTAASAKHQAAIKKKTTSMAPIETPSALNHLFVGRQKDSYGRHQGRNRTIAEAPSIAPLFTPTNIIPTPVQKARSPKQGLVQGHVLKEKKRGDSISSTSSNGDIRRQMYKTQKSIASQQQQQSLDSSAANRSRSSSTIESVGRNSISDGSTVCESELAAPAATGCTAANTEVVVVSTNAAAVECNTNEPQRIELVVPGEDTCDNSINSNSTSEQDSTETPPQKQQQQQPCSPKDINDNKKLDSSTTSSDSTPSTSEQSSSPTKSGDILTFDGRDIVQGPHFHDSPTKESTKQVNGRTLLQLATEPPMSKNESKNESKKSPTTPQSPQSPQSPTNGMTNLAYNSRKVKGQSEHGNLPFQVNLPSLGQKVFNPFPSQHMSKRRAQNGIKLGLYSPDNMPKLETGMVKGAPPKQFTRTQINTCLHRQYMAEVKQQANKKSTSSS